MNFVKAFKCVWSKKCSIRSLIIFSSFICLYHPSLRLPIPFFYVLSNLPSSFSVLFFSLPSIFHTFSNYLPKPPLLPLPPNHFFPIISSSLPFPLYFLSFPCHYLHPPLFLSFYPFSSFLSPFSSFLSPFSFISFPFFLHSFPPFPPFFFLFLSPPFPALLLYSFSFSSLPFNLFLSSFPTCPSFIPLLSDIYRVTKTFLDMISRS